MSSCGRSQYYFHVTMHKALSAFGKHSRVIVIIHFKDARNVVSTFIFPLRLIYPKYFWVRKSGGGKDNGQFVQQVTLPFSWRQHWVPCVIRRNLETNPMRPFWRWNIFLWFVSFLCFYLCCCCFCIFYYNATYLSFVLFCFVLFFTWFYLLLYYLTRLQELKMVWTF